MLLTYRKKFGLTIADVYFLNDENLAFEKKPDIAFYLQKSQKAKNSFDFYTLHSNLLEDEKLLFSRINKNTRNQINRAIKRDNIKCIVYKPDFKDILEFSNYYNVFAKLKKIPECSMRRLKALNDSDSLYFSKALDKEDNILCCHAYIVDSKRARSLYSISNFRDSDDSEYRAYVGRANKYLHWNDILAFKEKGLLIFDFGGIVVSDQEETELKNIAMFKKAFGGEMVHEYNLIEGISIVGKILAKVYNLIKGLRK